MSVDSLGVVDVTVAPAVAAVEIARRAAPGWAALTVRERAAAIGRVRALLVRHKDELAGLIDLPQRRSRAESVSAELLPLADAAKFLERQAPSILAPRRPGGRGLPAWLRGTQLKVERAPRGVVGILGPANYPLMLPGIQALQALVGGNTVVWKPGVGGGAVACRFAELLQEAGLPQGVLHVLDESRESGERLVDAGVDLIVLTGSAATGAAVSRALAGRPTATLMELSGCDAALVLEGADPQLAAGAVALGLTWSGSFTCIAPRRLFVHASLRADFERELRRRLDGVPAPSMALRRDDPWMVALAAARAAGAECVAGAWPTEASVAPVVLAGVPADSPLHREDFPYPSAVLETVATDDEAVRRAAAVDYGLGASVFGPQDRAESVAGRLPVGVVVINDMIVPTADPRAPFGGRGASGFGTTRGQEGLLEMTRPKTVLTRAGRFRPHYEPIGDNQAALIDAFLGSAHGAGLMDRIRARIEAVRAMMRIGRGGKG